MRTGDSLALLFPFVPSFNQTMTVDVVSGNLILYGATADNRTNDPAVDFARNVL